MGRSSMLQKSQERMKTSITKYIILKYYEWKKTWQFNEYIRTKKMFIACHVKNKNYVFEPSSSYFSIAVRRTNPLFSSALGWLS